MSQTQKPSEHDLPSASQLMKSTIIALAVAAILLVCVVMPAEYGKDPSGAGAFLGLKKMGEIKVSLEREAHHEEQKDYVKISLTDEAGINPDAGKENRDVTEFYLEPDAAIEIKLEMTEGSSARYKWVTDNGGLNFNLHGDGTKGSQQSVTYKKGRMVHSDSGKIVSEFDGYHGWFWRNRNSSPVTVTLETSGDYILIKQMK